jgi:hypothetical protein
MSVMGLQGGYHQYIRVGRWSPSLIKSVLNSSWVIITTPVGDVSMVPVGNNNGASLTGERSSSMEMDGILDLFGTLLGSSLVGWGQPNHGCEVVV